ncbi:MAG: hypothetical protein CL458_07585 [Acidimicrobiaceae bacterium]|nr:hypothetical protein [Acidimicrobiaceae bacterium]
MFKAVATSIVTVAVLMGSLLACGGTTQVVAPTPEPEPIVEETPEDDHDDPRQFLINTILDVEPGDAPEVIECVVDLMADLSGFSYTELKEMYLTQSPELDPYLESERFSQDCGADDLSNYSDEENRYENSEERRQRYASEFGECTSQDHEMCWEWNLSALRGTCGPDNDHEFCWRFKTYRPYISLTDAEMEARYQKKMDADTKKNAQRLVDLGWNKELSTPASYFVTSDLDESDRKIVEDGIKAAEEYLGSYGPMRVYVIGSDEAATAAAIEDYCSWAYDSDLLQRCRDDQGVGIWEIAHYKGSNAFAQHSHFLSTPTQSFVIGNPAQIGPADGAKVAAHEYVHIYQNAHQLYPEADLYGPDLAWPIWLEEGSAEFLALYLADQKGWLSFRERMTQALDESHDLREIVPNLTIADIAADRARVNAYCGLCFGTLQYATGQWATAWLVNRTSLDAVFLEFFPQVFELGIEGAFNRVFGLSTDQFMVEFESFMNLPRSEQLQILPIP